MDRNITALAVLLMYSWSLSARRAWIEIFFRGWTLNINGVALRKESVDRNSEINTRGSKKMVALRKESVDRNSSGAKADSPTKVALRKESVDRNFLAGRIENLS